MSPRPAFQAQQPDRSGARAVKRSYEVVGNREVGGALKGETVELELTEAQASALMEAGHVVPAEEVEAKATVAAAAVEAEPKVAPAKVGHSPFRK